MTTQIRLRRDTAANWAAANTVLENGEPGYETDTGMLKIGDGTTAWNALDYFSTGGGTTVTTTTSNIVDFGYCQSELAHGGWAGISDSDASVRAILQGIKDSGALRVRAAGWWSVIEPVDEGGYVWTGLDRFLTLIKEYGLTPLLCITRPTPTGVSIADYGELCGAIANRYGPSGTSGRANLLNDFEIWNEANHRSFAAPFSTGTDFGPATYVALLNAAVPAIRAANPNAFIISVGLMSTVDHAPNDIAPSTYLQGIYDNNGAGLFDAVGFHWYSGPSDFSGPEEPTTSQEFYLELLAVRAIMVAEGDAALKVWITEMGFPKSGATADVHVRTEWLLEQMEILVALPWVGPMFLFQYEETGPNYGVIGADHVKQQPLWDAIANINAISPQMLHNSVGDDHVIDGSLSGSKLKVSGTGGVGKFLAYAADGSLSSATPAGGGGGGSATPYGPVALPAMAADSITTITHGLGTTNLVPIVRRSALVTGSTTSAFGEIVYGVVVRVTTDPNSVTVEPSVDIADGELLLTLNPFTTPADVTGPTAATLSSPAHTQSTVDLLLTGGTDAGIGLAGAEIYRGPSGGSRTKVKTLTRGVNTWQDTGRVGGTAYDYSAKRLDLLGTLGTESNVLSVTTSAPTTPPVFDAASISSAVLGISNTLAHSWNHTAGNILYPGAIVAVVNTNNNIQHFHPTGTPTCTFGGVGLTYKGSVLMQNDDIRGFIAVWAGTGIPVNGSKAVATSISDTGDNNSKAYGAAYTYSGVASFGSLQTAYGSTANPAMAVTSATDRLLWALIANWFSDTISSPSFTLRSPGISTAQPAFSAGDKVGAASTSIDATMPARGWGIVKLEMLPAL